MTKWYYMDGQEKKGPYDEEQFVTMIKDGVISPVTYVWKSGMQNWEKANDTELKGNFDQENEMPPEWNGGMSASQSNNLQGNGYQQSSASQYSTLQNNQVVGEKEKKPRKKHKVRNFILIAIVVLILFCVVESMGDDTSTENANNTQTTESGSSGKKDKTTDKESNKESNKTDSPDDSGNYAIYDYFMQLNNDDADCPIHISEKAGEFLKKHGNLFTAKSLKESAKYADENVQYKMLSKDCDSYGNHLIHVKRAAINQVKVEKNVSYALVMDENQNVYYIFTDSKMKEFYEGDTIEFYGLPLDYTTYENTSGGNTWCVITALSSIKKIQ